MKPAPFIYDVIQVGYGPVSEIMALALARQGRSVAIFERWEERYPLPRAVCIDHEIYRMLSALGLGEQLPAVSHTGPVYRWFNAEWKELLAIDWSAESISGGPEVNFIHQPTLEAMFDVAVRTCPNVDLNLGWEAIEVNQHQDFAELIVRNAKSGETRTFHAQYIIGADGANSMVRKAIGDSSEDLGFEADWLVIDILPKEGVILNIPPAAQYCNPERPTTIVPAGVKDGRFYRRWEFMRLPNETNEELEQEAVAWKLLKEWVSPEQATIVRHKVYTFRSLLANDWHKKRFLIAGDAAHVMPPFMGQGMCSGLRDDWNLAWKIGLILDGKASPKLLNSYQPERRPHARNVIEMSMFLGKIICISDPQQAAERDEAFFSGKVPPPPAFPWLTDGILRRNSAGEVQLPAGKLSPHGKIRMGNQQGRFDDLVGLGFVLIVQNAETLARIDSTHQCSLTTLKVKQVHIVANESMTPNTVQDMDNKFLPYMKDNNIEAMLIRPDFYLYGAISTTAEINQLINDFINDLKQNGINL